MRSMTPPVVAILWAAVAATPALAQIPWNNDLRTAHSQAKQEGKLLLMHFYTDNCVWCDRLEAGAFQSTALAEAIVNDYVPVKIHAGMNPRIAKTFRVSRFPTDVIVTTDGTVLSHGVSPQDPDKFIGLLAQHALDQPAQNASLAGTSAPASGQQPTVAAGASPSVPQQAAATPQPAPPASQAVAGVPLPQSNPYAPVRQPAPAKTHPTPSPAGDAIASTSASAAATNTARPPQTAASSRPNAGFTLPSHLGDTPASPAGYGDTTNAPPANGAEQPPGIASSSEQAPSRPSVTDPTIGSDQIMINPELAADLTQHGPSSTANAPAPADESAADEVAFAEAPPVALQGFCPVTLIQKEQWVAGQPELGLVHLGQLYLFADQAALETFRADPEPYTPVMNSNDVVLFFREQRIVEGRRDWGVFDPEFNRIFLFANEETMNHFRKHYQHYVRNAIMLTRQAAADASTQRR